MKNQFFYTVTQTVAPGAPTRPNEETITRSFIASFNVNKVIRSLEIEDGTMIVILDDFHEETRQGVVPNHNGKPIVKNETTVLQSEIVLNEEDKKRFLKLTTIE